MIISQTPLRISFLGGNTDFREFYTKHGGGVLSTAIDKYIYCIVNKRFDKKIYVNYSRKEIVDSVDKIQHDLVRECLKKVRIKDGIEVSYLADIPSEGSGLGSSSSFTVGTLHALYQYVGHNPSAEQLAKEAVEVEIDILKNPIGVQDQYIAAYGGFRFLQFNKDGSITPERITIPEEHQEDIDNSFMLFFTGQVRKTGNILQSLHKSIGNKTNQLLKNYELAKDGKVAVEENDLNKLGLLLHEYWEIKKSLSPNISNSEIDNMYIQARKAGAIGGKISGAGGGGFMLLLVPGNKRKNVRNILKNYREMPFRICNSGSKIIFNIN
jgi:D-glycero-alpha-D-manno-heptose-7-phosphate kinase